MDDGAAEGFVKSAAVTTNAPTGVALDEMATGAAGDDEEKHSSFKQRKTQGGVVSVGTRALHGRF